MLDRASFRAILHGTLDEIEAESAVELHLHGGESFFLRSVKEVGDAHALCDIIPTHEWGRGPTGVPARTSQEAAIPYAAMADLFISPRTVDAGPRVRYRGADEARSDLERAS